MNKGLPAKNINTTKEGKDSITQKRKHRTVNNMYLTLLRGGSSQQEDAWRERRVAREMCVRAAHQNGIKEKKTETRIHCGRLMQR